MLFLKNHVGNEAERLVPDFFLFLKQLILCNTGSALQLSFHYILIVLNSVYHKNKLYKNKKFLAIVI